MNNEINTNASSDNSLGTRKRQIIIYLAVSFLVLIVSAALYAISYADNIFDRIVQQDEYVSMSDAELMALMSEDMISTGDVAPEDILSAEEQNELDRYVAEVTVSEDGLWRQDGVTNILLLGIDTRNRSSMKGRSDSIILVSINENIRQVSLVSVMRDTYVKIPNNGSNKINAAYAFGGANLAVKTVEQAFGIDIDRYAVVNFYGFMDIIDTLGGINLNIEKGELKYLNKYVKEINSKLGLNTNSGTLNTYGENTHVTGKQAMGYVRIRYYGDGDYMRTQRQRNVLMQIIEKAKNADVLELIDVIDVVADYTRTDMTPEELLDLAKKAPEYLQYNIIQDRVPRDGTFKGGMGHGMWIIQMDFEANRSILKEIIYGAEAQ